MWIESVLLCNLPDFSRSIECSCSVDDLKEGFGAEYVDISDLSLIFLSDGYFSSPNCMRELLRAVITGKRIMSLSVRISLVALTVVAANRVRSFGAHIRRSRKSDMEG